MTTRSLSVAGDFGASVAGVHGQLGSLDGRPFGVRRAGLVVFVERRVCEAMFGGRRDLKNMGPRHTDIRSYM